MTARPTKEHLDVTLAHIIGTLPDSLRLRKTVLVTLLSLFPRGSEQRITIKIMIETLRSHEADQLKFSAIDE